MNLIRRHGVDYYVIFDKDSTSLIIYRYTYQNQNTNYLNNIICLLSLKKLKMEIKK